MKRPKSPLFPIFIVLFLDNFGLSIVFILFAPLMLNPEYGFLPAEISTGSRNILLSLLFGSFSLTQFLGSPILGDLADHYGRKKSLIYAIYGLTIGFLLCGIAIEFHSFLGLLAGRLITGFFAGNISICLATISDLAKDEKHRSKLFGLVAFFFGISFILGMLSGGFLSDKAINCHFCPELPFWIASFFSVISAFCIRYFFVETCPPLPGVKVKISKAVHHIAEISTLPKVRLLYASYFFWAFAWTGCILQFGAPILMEHFKKSQLESTLFLISIGIFWSLGGAVFNRFLTRKFMSYPIAIFSLFGMIILLAWASFAPLGLFEIAISMTAILSAMVMSNLMNLISIHSPENSQGTAMGLSRAVISLATLFTPLLGLITAKFNIFALIPIASLFAIISIIILYSWKRRSLINSSRN